MQWRYLWSGGILLHIDGKYPQRDTLIEDTIGVHTYHSVFCIPNTFLWQMVNLGNERIDQEMHRPICRDGSDQNPTQNLGKIKLGHLADPSKIKNKTQNWPDEVGKNWPNPSLDISQSISIFWLITVWTHSTTFFSLVLYYN